MEFYSGKFNYYLKVILFLSIFVITDISCATQNKHRQIKAVPCPCESQNKR